MAKSRTRRKPLGNAKHIMSAPIPGATLSHTDPKVIEQMNRKLKEKCERQKVLDAATEAIADKMWVI